jgi:glycosyltransferase involved in cell wall biosynthesis
MTGARPVIMLTNAVSPDKLGGLERYVRELARALVAVGTPVTVVAKKVSTEHPDVEVAEDGVRLVRHSVPSKKDPAFAAKYPLAVASAVRRELREAGQGALLHGHFSVTSLAPAMRKLPFVFTFHAPVYRELLSERQSSYVLPRPLQQTAVAALKQAERKVVRSAEQIIVLSDFMRTELSKLDPAAAERASLVPGGIDTERFSPGPAQDESWARGGAPVLVVARRLTPRTGVTELIEAMPQVLRDLPHAKLAVLGDGGQREHIADRILQLGLGDSVKMFGRVTDAQLVSWYRRADLVVMPTQELEGFGLTTAEAMACGTPVLVTPVGANAEVIRALGPRFQSSAPTPDSLARAIVELATDDASLSTAAKGARDAIHPHMSWTAIAEIHQQLYAGLS